jgi:hypothetical protein
LYPESDENEDGRDFSDDQKLNAIIENRKKGYECPIDCFN